MIPFALKENLLTLYHVTLFKKVVVAVENLEDGLTCHEVCERIASEIPGLKAVRGKFNYYDHSWLVIEDSRAIIDAYPWACGSGPILIDCQTGSPWATLYKAVNHEALDQETTLSDRCQIQGKLRSQEPPCGEG